MYKNLKLYIPIIVVSVTSIATLMAVAWAIRGFRNFDLLIIVVFSAVYFIILLPEDHEGKILERIVRYFLFVPHNILLLFLGNIENRNKLKRIEERTELVYGSELFASIAGIDLRKPGTYYIIYSHLQNSENEHRIFDGRGYKITGFPLDETETIMRTWFYVSNYLRLDWENCWISCSCKDALEGKDRNKVLKSSMSIVGSVKGNEFTRILMEHVMDLNKDQKRGILPYIMEEENNSETGDKLCYLRATYDSNDTLKPSPLHKDTSKRPDSSEKLLDYAIIAKLPNIMNRCDNDHVKVDHSNSILLMAGCKTAGQIAILNRLYDLGNMQEISNKYRNNYFCEVIKVEWNYIPRGLPRILKLEIIDRKEINI